jgi:class 3 adenylate cyclase/YHS domain-containing protein
MAMEEKTILFADLSGFTALTEAHGDERATTIVLRFYDMARSVLRDESVLVKTIGDAVMIVCSDARACVLIALELLSLVNAEPAFPMMRAGLHIGPVTEAAGDFFGNAVNIAARVAAYAKSGQLLCTEAIASSLGVPLPCVVSRIGPVVMKNVQHDVVIYELRCDVVVKQSFVDPVCRMHVSAGDAAGHVSHAGEDVYFCSFECMQAFEVAHHEGDSQ